MAPQDRNLKWRLELEDAFSKQGARIQQIAAAMTKQMQEAARAVATLRAQLRALRPGGAEGQAVRAQQQALRLQQQINALQQRQAAAQQRMQAQAAQAAQRLAAQQQQAAARLANQQALAQQRLHAQQALFNQRLAQQQALAQQRALRAQARAAAQAQRANAGAIVGGPPRAAGGGGGAGGGGLGAGSGDIGGIGFSVRRLLGVLAVFTLFRNAVSGVKTLIAEGVRFNQVIERSRLGIAGIITSLATVRDEQGRVTEGAEKFELSLRAASSVQKALLLDAVRTTATFDELSQTFQVALGPGLAAGLNLDEVRQFTTAISQAATALDIPQFQLSEEVRSLLSGQIRQGQSRIATVLNLTNEDIRQFKAQGTLFQELQSRLQGFATAAEKAAQTASGSFLRLKDAILLVLGEAAQPLADQLTSTLSELLRLFADINATEVRLNPETVKALTPIFQTLTEIVRDLGQRLLTVDFNKLGASIRRSLGPVKQLVESAIEIGAAFVAALPPILELAGGLSRLFAPLVGLLGPALQLAAIFGTFRVIGRLLTQFGNLLLGPVRAFRQVRQGAKDVRAEVLSLGTIFSRVFGAGGIVATALQLTLEKVLGIKVGLFEAIGLLGAGLLRGVVAAFGESELLSELDRRIAFGINRSQGEQGGPDTPLDVPLVPQLDPEVEAQQKRLNEEEKRRFENQRRTALAAAAELATKARNLEIERQIGELRSRGASDADVSLARLRLEAAAQDEILENLLAQFKFKLEEKRAELDAATTDEERVALRQEILNLRQEELNAIQEQENRQRELNHLLREEYRSRQDALNVREKELAISRAETDARIIELRRVGATEQQQRELDVAANENARLAAEARIAAIRLETLTKVHDLERRIAAARAAGDPALAQQLAREYAQTLDEQNQKLQEQRALLAALDRELPRLDARAQGDAVAGLREGVKEFVDQIGNAFDAFSRIAADSLQALGSALTNTLVQGTIAWAESGSFDAFLDTAEEQLASFLQAIAEAIIQQLIQLAIAASIGRAAAAPVAQGGQVVAMAEGGPVPSAAAGPPVPGAPPSDRVRALLSPREFVQPVSAVNAYGADFMEALRQRAIRPADARALLGGRSFSPRRVSPSLRVPTFASGGQLATATATAGRAASGAARGRQTLGVLPVRAHELDRFVNSGAFDRAMMDWQRRNNRAT